MILVAAWPSIRLWTESSINCRNQNVRSAATNNDPAAQKSERGTTFL
jgi:hypothetical protein